MSAAHVRMLLYDLHHLGTKEHSYDDPEGMPPALVVLDSEAALAMAKNDRDTARTRHIARRYHYVRHGVASNEHMLAWVPSEEQMADFLTKNGDFTKLLSQVFMTL